MLAIGRDMEELCPQALLINYTNPMAMLCWAMNAATRIRNVGLCHSVQGTSMDLARYIGAPYEEIGAWVAGINHIAWFLRFERNGQDAYPALREAMADPDLFARDAVRFEVFKHFGYFVTESSGHMSEYVPWFRKRADLRDQFHLPSRRPPQDGRQRAWWWQDENTRKQLAGEVPINLAPSHEYAAHIMHAIETDEPFRFNGNVRNGGAIANLPADCCVEVPCVVDKTGVHPCVVGELPTALAAMNLSNVAVQSLTVQAILEGCREKAIQAVLLDPLTAAVCSLAEARAMGKELFAADAEWLGYLR
jgi:alpha-galactosidase